MRMALSSVLVFCPRISNLSSTSHSSRDPARGYLHQFASPVTALLKELVPSLQSDVICLQETQVPGALRSSAHPFSLGRYHRGSRDATGTRPALHRAKRYNSLQQ
jgi:hypothetical protein